MLLKPLFGIFFVIFRAYKLPRGFDNLFFFSRKITIIVTTFSLTLLKISKKSSQKKALTCGKREPENLQRPTESRFVNLEVEGGGEMVEGDFFPRRFLRMQKEAILKAI
jgi:hypothetical protein